MPTLAPTPPVPAQSVTKRQPRAQPAVPGATPGQVDDWGMKSSDEILADLRRGMKRLYGADDPWRNL